MVITEIQIDNVKGLQHYILDQQLQPNRPNILVAPNGFGKSSFAIAFKSLCPNKLQLEPEHYYLGDERNVPSLTLKLSTGKTLIADTDQDTIKDFFDIYVINSSLKPKATAQHYGNRTIPRASMDIKPTVIYSTIPPKASFGYSYRGVTHDFGVNGKILMDIAPLFTNAKFLNQVSQTIDLHQFELMRFKIPCSKILESINAINHQRTAEQIKGCLDEKLIELDHAEFNKLCELVRKHTQYKQSLDVFLVAWQFVHIRQQLGAGRYNRAKKYIQYLNDRREIDETLGKLNPVSDRFIIKSRVKDNSLIIEWPKAEMISSGQRDILTFTSQLMECRFHRSIKPCILVIDEFFDYLDDANLVAFQYYVSNLIDEYRKNHGVIFPILLTHLDPNYLKHFCFNDKRLNICYLKNSMARISDKMWKLITSRENEIIKDEIDTYFVHYHPRLSDVDMTDQFSRLSLNLDWKKPEKFRKKVETECRDMICRTEMHYDPIAVCIAIRIKIEENVYNLIHEENLKEEFLDKHGTIEKLNYAQGLGIAIPETYYLLGLIYNHPLHITDDSNIHSMAKQLGMKLENNAIKSMIQHLWSPV